MGVYGGFFGAAMGIVMLALLSLLMEDDIQARNAVKILIASLINGVAAIYFLWAGLVSVRAAAIMTGGAVVGGYVGALLARRTPAGLVRALVVAIGLGISVLLAYRAFWADRSRVRRLLSPAPADVTIRPEQRRAFSRSDSPSCVGV